MDDIQKIITDNINESNKVVDWWYDLWHYTSPFSNIRDGYYKVRNYLFRRYDLIRTGLSKTSWCDKDYLMLYGMMGLLVDYVEKEKCFETIEWDSDKDHKRVAKEIRAIYDWWKDYPNREKAISDQLHTWHTEFEKRPEKDWIDKFNKDKPSKKEEKESEKLHEMEKALANEEEKMLIRLIKIRKYLWT